MGDKMQTQGVRTVWWEEDAAQAAVSACWINPCFRKKLSISA